MSVIVTANYKGETFEVEIFRDGSIDFPDRDLQYEQALAEFYPPGSPLVQLYEEWCKTPMAVIFDHFDHMELPKDAKPRLAADYAEHVLHIFESAHQKDRRPRAAIVAARDFLDEKTDWATLEVAAEEADKAAKTGWAADWAAARSAVRAAWAAEAELAARAAARAAEAAALAAEAAALAVSPDSNSRISQSASPEFQQGYNAEVAWQVRRFVDCMEAVGLGKDWPDLKVTT